MIDEMKAENTEPDHPGETSEPGESGFSIADHQSPIVNHKIHLRGFWDTSSAGTGKAHSRNFGRPRTLGPGERVWLVCASVPGPAEASVNGQPAGSAPESGPFAADITDLLRPRNTVVFTVASTEALGEVTLEIRGIGT
jgi:hypothetical protein